MDKIYSKKEIQFALGTLYSSRIMPVDIEDWGLKKKEIWVSFSKSSQGIWAAVFIGLDETLDRLRDKSMKFPVLSNWNEWELAENDKVINSIELLDTTIWVFIDAAKGKVGLYRSYDQATDKFRNT